MRRPLLLNAATYLGLVVGAVLTLAPYLLSVQTSVKTERQFASTSPLAPPAPVTGANYAELVVGGHSLVPPLVITVQVVLVVVLGSSPKRRNLHQVAQRAVDVGVSAVGGALQHVVHVVSDLDRAEAGRSVGHAWSLLAAFGVVPVRTAVPIHADLDGVIKTAAGARTGLRLTVLFEGGAPPFAFWCVSLRGVASNGGVGGAEQGGGEAGSVRVVRRRGAGLRR